LHSRPSQARLFQRISEGKESGSRLRGMGEMGTQDGDTRACLGGQDAQHGAGAPDVQARTAEVSEGKLKGKLKGSWEAARHVKSLTWEVRMRSTVWAS